jgi:hypothetical protein
MAVGGRRSDEQQQGSTPIALFANTDAHLQGEQSHSGRAFPGGSGEIGDEQAQIVEAKMRILYKGEIKHCC